MNNGRRKQRKSQLKSGPMDGYLQKINFNDSGNPKNNNGRDKDKAREN